MLIAWLLLLAGAAWVIAGYPAMVLLRARYSAPPALSATVDCRPTVVSVLIVVRDGGPWVLPKLQSVICQQVPGVRLRLVVVSDGSTDDTNGVLDRLRAQDSRLLVVHQGPRGKAAGIAAALPHLEGDIVVMTDIRQPIAPGTIEALVGCFVDPAVGVVSGELVFQLKPGSRGGEAGFYWKIESAIRRALAARDSTIGATGPLYAIRRELLVAPPAGTILDDVFIPSQAFLKGYRLQVEPGAIAWERPISQRQEFRRKVRTAAGMYQLLRLEPRLLSPRRNRLFLDFMSYKVGRLLLPHLLVLEVALLPFLPRHWSVPAACLHAAATMMILVGLYAPDGTVLRRIGTPFASIATMVLAAFLGHRALFGRVDTLWTPTAPASVEGME